VGIMGELPTVFCDCCGEDYLQDKMLRLANHLIANGVTVREWISVENRLPEDDASYLVWASDSGESEVALYYGDGEWLTNDLKNITRFVSYWMPLPKPPKEETL
jgi:hypothetical protein